MYDIEKLPDEAGAELKRLRTQAVPQGWHLLPTEPTPQILDALRTGSRKDWPSDELCRVRYAALLAKASAPAAPSAQGEAND